MIFNVRVKNAKSFNNISFDSVMFLNYRFCINLIAIKFKINLFNLIKFVLKILQFNI